MLDFNDDNLIVYTCLIGDNEGLNAQPFFSSSKLRHVCLTDDKELKSNDWEIILVDRIIPQDCYRSQRNFKIRPHIIFPNYKYSLYIDNTVVLKKKTEDFLEFITNEIAILKNDPFFCLPYHSQFNLINEFNACANNHLDDQWRIYEQLNDYIKTNAKPLKEKAYWGGILLRNHNNIEVIKLSEIWFSHICRYSRRDQLSIIHSSLQSKITLRGFQLSNSSSKFHDWPITKTKRKNRNFKNNYIEYIPNNYLENLEIKIKENEELLLQVEKYRKIKNLLIKSLKFENLFFMLKKFFKKFFNY